MSEFSPPASELNTPSESVGKSKNLLQTTEQLLDQYDKDTSWKVMDRIYNNYVGAITRRDREPLAYGRFIFHHFNGGNYEESLAWGGKKDGYLLGSNIEDVFVPTHFAPESLKGGYKLIKDLVHSDQPVALFITDDLVKTIEKMDGWIVLPFKFKAKFRGEDVEKTLVVNHWEAPLKLAKHEVKKFVNNLPENSRHQAIVAKYKIKKFAEKVINKIKGNESNAFEIDDEFDQAYDDD